MSQMRINELIQKNIFTLQQHQNVFIDEQNTCGMNHLFTIAYDIQTQYACAQHTSTTASAPTTSVQNTTLLYTRHINKRYIYICVCVCVLTWHFIVIHLILIINFNQSKGLESFGSKTSVLIFLYAHKHMQYEQWHTTEFYLRICQHHNVYSIKFSYL
jgi:hypothetical protein